MGPALSVSFCSHCEQLFLGGSSYDKCTIATLNFINNMHEGRLIEFYLCILGGPFIFRDGFIMLLHLFTCGVCGPNAKMIQTPLRKRWCSKMTTTANKKEEINERRSSSSKTSKKAKNLVCPLSKQKQTQWHFNDSLAAPYRHKYRSSVFGKIVTWARSLLNCVGNSGGGPLQLPPATGIPNLLLMWSPG